MRSPALRPSPKCCRRAAARWPFSTSSSACFIATPRISRPRSTPSRNSPVWMPKKPPPPPPHTSPGAEAAPHRPEPLAVRPADNELAWLILGAIFERQKQYDKAEEEFKKVIDVNPKNSMVLNYYGYMLADRGIRLDEARDLIQRALAQEPYTAAFFDRLAWPS